MSPAVPEPALGLERVEAFRSGRRVLGPLDLRLDRGEALLLTGPNGAGKTTILLLLLGLLTPSSGTASVLGARVLSPGWRRLRRRVGYVNQSSVQTTLPIAAREVVEIGVAALRLSAGQRRVGVETAMRRTGCLHLGPRAYRELSGGEKRRVDIARCLAQEPEILLLDEPASALDSGARRLLSELLEQLHAQGLTILVVSHETESLPAWPAAELRDGLIAGGKR